MSTYDDASLIMFPSGYKEDKIYSLKPTDGSGDLTFTRASSATRVNAEGLIETASILGTELISSTLINSNYDTFNEASVSGFHAIYSTSGTQRAATLDEISFVTGKTYQVNIDVSVVSGSEPFLRAREAIATSPTIFSGQLVAGNNLITFTSANTLTGILEFSSTTASEYRVSNVSVKEVITNNVPRIDYTSGCGKLLLEPQRTNIITYSNSNSLNFALDNVSMSYNSVISPDGTTNGILFKQTGTSNSNSAYNYGLTTADGTYTYSIFLKASDSESIRIYSSNGAATLTQDFNPQTMTDGILAGSLNLNFQDYGNGWFRMSFARTLSSAANHRLSIYPDRNNTQKGLYIYGIQVEVSSFPTSYIPTTSGTAVTRVVDDYSLSNIRTNGLISASGGSWLVHITNNESRIRDAGGGGLYLNESDAFNGSNGVRIGQTSTGLSQLKVVIYLSGVATTFNLTDEEIKVAFSWNGTTLDLWVNGTKEIDAMAFTFTDMEFLGSNLDVSYIVQNELIFPTALSDADAIALTTL